MNNQFSNIENQIYEGTIARTHNIGLAKWRAKCFLKQL